MKAFPQLGAIYLVLLEGAYWPHLVVLHKLKNALDETFALICLPFRLQAVSDFSPKNLPNESWVILEPCLFHNFVVIPAGYNYACIRALARPSSRDIRRVVRRYVAPALQAIAGVSCGVGRARSMAPSKGPFAVQSLIILA